MVDDKIKNFHKCLSWFINVGKILEKKISDKESEFSLTSSPILNFTEYEYAIPYYTLLDNMGDRQLIYISHHNIQQLIDGINDMGIEPNEHEKKTIEDLKKTQEVFKNWAKYNTPLSVIKNDLFYKAFYRYNVPFYI